MQERFQNLIRAQVRRFDEWRKRRLAHTDDEKSDIRRVIIHLAWPCIIEQVLITTVGIVVTMFTGRIGPTALAAAGMVNMVVTFVQAVFAALSTGCTVLVARVTGEGQPQLARSAVRQAMLLALFSSVVVTALCMAFAEPLLHLFLGDNDPIVLEEGLKFFRIVLWSFPCLIINLIISGGFRGAGDARTPMIISGVVNLVNVVLCVLFVSGTPITPSLGLTGAGIASTASRAVGMVLILLMLFGGRARIQLHWRDGFKLEFPIIRRMMGVGLSASMEQVVLQGGFLFMSVLIQRMSTNDAAAYQVANSINSLAMMPVLGLTMATTTLVGQALGAGNPKRAKMCALQSLFFSEIIICLMGVLLYVFASPLAGLYTEDAAVLHLSTQALRILALAEPSLGVLNIFAATLRGAGDNFYVMFSSIIGIWVLRVGLTFFFQGQYGWGVVGVYVAMLSDYTVRAILYTLRYRKGKWLTIRV